MDVVASPDTVVSFYLALRMLMAYQWSDMFKISISAGRQSITPMSLTLTSLTLMSIILMSLTLNVTHSQRHSLSRHSLSCHSFSCHSLCALPPLRVWESPWFCVYTPVQVESGDDGKPVMWCGAPSPAQTGAPLPRPVPSEHRGYPRLVNHGNITLIWEKKTLFWVVLLTSSLSGTFWLVHREQFVEQGPAHPHHVQVQAELQSGQEPHGPHARLCEPGNTTDPVYRLLLGIEPFPRLRQQGNTLLTLWIL